MDDLVIETQNLTKHYDEFVAVDGLNLSVRQGEVFGLLGPNGSGKTTTILMLLGLTEPTAGSVRVLSFDPVRQPLSVKARVGYLPDQVGFYDELTARENLVYITRLNGLRRDEAHRRIDNELARVGLSEVADKQVATFSHGMRQRLGVAEVLLKHPQLVIMDEPTQGLDPDGAREFLELIRGLREKGITILLASHLLYQVQAICDRVGLFHQGHMMLDGTVKELAQRVLGGAYRIHLEVDGPAAALEQALSALPGVVQVKRPCAGAYDVEARRDLRGEAARAAVEAGGTLLALDFEQASLDEIYAQYFKEVGHAIAA
ncbi:MAG: ABC transporter ATP-binding protein [Ardenticatenaceae bacterium]|nr:ABC transporter ATP-binding protein [Ardenticatenaceae bacterium]